MKCWMNIILLVWVAVRCLLKQSTEAKREKWPTAHITISVSNRQSSAIYGASKSIISAPEHQWYMGSISSAKHQAAGTASEIIVSSPVVYANQLRTETVLQDEHNSESASFVAASFTMTLQPPDLNSRMLRLRTSTAERPHFKTIKTDAALILGYTETTKTASTMTTLNDVIAATPTMNAAVTALITVDTVTNVSVPKFEKAFRANQLLMSVGMNNVTTTVNSSTRLPHQTSHAIKNSLLQETAEEYGHILATTDGVVGASEYQRPLQAIKAYVNDTVGHHKEGMDFQLKLEAEELIHLSNTSLQNSIACESGCETDISLLNGEDASIIDAGSGSGLKILELPVEMTSYYNYTHVGVRAAANAIANRTEFGIGVEELAAGNPQEETRSMSSRQQNLGGSYEHPNSVLRAPQHKELSKSVATLFVNDIGSNKKLQPVVSSAVEFASSIHVNSQTENMSYASTGLPDSSLNSATETIPRSNKGSGTNQLDLPKNKTSAHVHSSDSQPLYVYVFGPLVVLLLLGTALFLRLRTLKMYRRKANVSGLAVASPWSRSTQPAVLVTRHNVKYENGSESASPLPPTYKQYLGSLTPDPVAPPAMELDLSAIEQVPCHLNSVTSPLPYDEASVQKYTGSENKSWRDVSYSSC